MLYFRILPEHQPELLDTFFTCTPKLRQDLSVFRNAYHNKRTKTYFEQESVWASEVPLGDQTVEFVLFERREKPWHDPKLVGHLQMALTLEQMPMYYRTETEAKHHNLFSEGLFNEKGCSELHLLQSLDRFLKNLFGKLQVKLLELLTKAKESPDAQLKTTKMLEQYLVKSEARVEA